MNCTYKKISCQCKCVAFVVKKEYNFQLFQCQKHATYFLIDFQLFSQWHTLHYFIGAFVAMRVFFCTLTKYLKLCVVWYRKNHVKIKYKFHLSIIGTYMREIGCVAHFFIESMMKMGSFGRSWSFLY